MRLRLRVVGQVQGVGFRPWVARTATALGLDGWVQNAADGVWIEVQGTEAERLVAALEQAPSPIRAELTERHVVDDEEATGFSIRPSAGVGERLPTLPPDLATCERCFEELDDPTDRRFGYLLLSCTACGPRYSMAGPPPFDRERTAMAAFPLCGACAAEYDDPLDRRYHAQATACAVCGPRLSSSSEAAIETLRAGGIVAVKGLSGFQLMCDATDEAAVSELRRRKRRPDKPLAVMVEQAQGLTAAERAVFASEVAPVVLTAAEVAVAPGVAHGSGLIGLMRPSTPVHRALVRGVGRPLVCTSANVSGEPLVVDEVGIGSLADQVLAHDRPVWRGADDSVVRVMGERARVLRRARGHAPRPVRLGRGGAPLLAMGADITSAVALAIDDQAVLSPYLGRLGGRAVLARVEHEARGLCEMYGVRPQGVVVDAHPGLVATRLGVALAMAWDVPVHRVFHHHAHVAAVCAEHSLDGPVLGIAFDGVGMGPDGTTWGGEVLRVDGDAFDRVAHLRPFALPGGDACAREPGRMALALLHGAGLDVDERLHPRAVELWRWMDTLPTSCSAMGRLFDGVAVLAGLPGEVSFEAQLPMAFEAAALSAEPQPAYPASEDPLDWRPWVHGVVADRDASVPLPVIARRFHTTVVEAVIRVVGDHRRVALCGGCFQNALLVDGLFAALPGRVWLGAQVPPGDGGIALGQAWVARRMGG